MPECQKNQPTFVNCFYTVLGGQHDPVYPIIGFTNNKREVGASLPHDRSFEFLRIWNGSEMVANSLILMAIAKMESEDIEDILNARKILTVISEYAEGGAKHVLEIRQTPGMEQKFNYSDDYFDEIVERNQDFKG